MFSLDNLSVHFISDSAYPVKAVFDGIVAATFVVGDQFCVVVRFGNYYIAYFHLVNPIVKKGDAVRKGQYIGELCTDDDNVYELQIMLYSKSKEMNPYQWFAWKAPS